MSPGGERRCAECGASYDDANDSCDARFAILLALDHSRREPWGSRHLPAFAVFSLQHPSLRPASVDHHLAVLYRIYVEEVAREVVVAALRRNSGSAPSEWTIPSRPRRPVHRPTLNIKDLGDFPAESYATQLDAWCRATLESWGVTGVSER